MEEESKKIILEIEHIKSRLEKIEKIIKLLAERNKDLLKNLKKTMINARLIFEEDGKSGI